MVLKDWVEIAQLILAFIAIISVPVLIIQLKQIIKSNKMLGEQLKLSAQANRGEIVIGLFNEFRDPKWHEYRIKIIEEGEDLKLAEVANYIHLLNHFGFLLEHNYVDIRPLYETFGENVIHTWKLLESQILERRNTAKEKGKYYPYQYHFQYLNYRLEKYAPKGRNHINKLILEMES